MFEKKEDKLFEYAFGDLDAHEAQIFEANLLKDEVSAEEAKFLQSIKGDLMSFRDIPEMQYSKERLRDAILGQGLKPSKPAFPWLNWVLAPGAVACVFALGFILTNGTSRKDPVIVGAPMTADSSKPSGLKMPKQELTAPGSVVATNTDKKTNSVENVTPAAASAPKSVVRASRYVREAAYRPSKKPVSAEHSEGTLLAMNVAKEITSVPIASVASMSGNVERDDSWKDMTESAPKADAPAVDATIISINKDQDSGVGAPVATEVNDTKNVVIGG